MADIDVFNILGQNAKNGSGIRLLNIYKGLPISYETTISSIGQAEIQVSSNQQQAACLYYQRETYLQVKESPFIIRSQVISLNLGKEQAVLSNFELAKNNIGNRSQIRVEPDEPLMATVYPTGAIVGINSPLADISAEGASFFVDAFLFSGRVFQPGSELTMTITLPDTVAQKIKRNSPKPLVDIRKGRDEGQISITARGKIISARPETAQNRYRIGARMHFQDLARMVILQYISQRQIEIIRDLRILSNELFRLKK